MYKKLTSTFKLIHESKATPKYKLTVEKESGLSSLFNGEEWPYEQQYKNYLFLEHEGDAYFDGDLLLDWAAGFVNSEKYANWRKKFNLQKPPTGDHGIKGIIVDGNLEVSGSIINACSNDGPFLLIRGNLKARNLVGGGAYIRIFGNADIVECVYAHYNAGSLHIYGDLETQVVISDDHDYCVKGKTNAKFLYDSFAVYVDENAVLLEWDDDDDIIIPKQLRQLLNSDIKKWDDILPTLCSGISILNVSAAYPANDLLEHYTKLFENKVADNENLEKILLNVPQQCRTLAICEKAVALCGLNIQYVPEELINGQLVEIALQSAPEAIEFVSPQYLTENLCRQAIINADNGYLLQFMPEKFKTQEMCMLAAKHCVDLEYIPQEFIDKDNVLLKEILMHHPPQYTSLSPENKTNTDLILATLHTPNEQWSYIKENFQDALQRLALMKTIIQQSVQHIECFEGYEVMPEIYQYAESLWSTHPQWQKIVNSHTEHYIQHLYLGADATDQQKQELEIKFGKWPWHNPFKQVWAVFWNDLFIIDVIKNIKPYCDIELVPTTFLTMKIIKFALEHDEFGYYKDRIDEEVYSKYIKVFDELIKLQKKGRDAEKMFVQVENLLPHHALEFLEKA